MKSSIKEVARLAGVSVATVSHVLNNTKNVRPATRQRVEEAVGKLNYQINPIARNLRKGESKMIGFVVSNLSNYFFSDIARSLEDSLLKKGYRPVLIDSKEDKNIEIENVKNLLASSVDGLVIAPTTEEFSYLNHVMGRKKVPVVFVDRRPVGYEGDLVMAANEQGSYNAVKHLTSIGHRRIACVGSRFDSTMKERIDGYRRAIDEAGIPVDENLIKMGDKLSVSPHELRHGTSYKQTKELLLNSDVTAVFAGNTLACIGAFTCIRELGRKVPEEVAFITFDDSFWITMTTPALSAVAQNPVKIGTAAGEIICARLDPEQEQPSTFLHVRIPTKLILRESC